MVSVAFLVLALAVGAGPGHPAESFEEPLLVDLVYQGRPLAQGLEALRRGERVLLPLSEVTESLGFELEVDPVTGRASGWFVSEERTFELDLTKTTVTLGGVGKNFPADRAATREGDLLVDSALLAEWFPVELTIDFASLTVQVRPRETLPFERRDLRRSPLPVLAESSEAASWPEVAVPYRWLDWPLLEGTLSGNFSSTGFQTSHELHGLGDVLGLTGEWWLRHDFDGRGTEPSLRGRLGRRDASGRALGGLGVTEFLVGDLSLPPAGPGRRGRQVFGALVSSLPLEELDLREVTSLTGEGPAGWDVELLRDGLLLDVGRVGDDGRYRFADVPVYRGANFFTLSFHGPHGERHEERRRFILVRNAFSPGQAGHRFAVGRWRGEGEEGRSAAFESTLGLGGGGVAVLRWDREVPEGSDPRDTYGFGLRVSREGVFGAVDLSSSARGDCAARGTLQSLWPRFNLGLEHLEEFGRTPERRSEIRLHGLLRGGYLGAYSLVLEAGSGSNGSRRRWATSLSGRVSGVTWTQFLRIEESAGRDPAVSASLLASGRVDRALLRAEVEFRLESLRDTLRLERASVAVELPIGPGRSVRVMARHTTALESRTALAVSAGWRSSRLRLELAAGHEWAGASSGWSGQLSVGYLFWRDPLSRRWRLRDANRGPTAAVAARVFLDRDRDGRFGPTDEPLPAVALRALENGQPAVETDPQGVALLDGLPAYRPAAIGLEVGTLLDPSWLARQDGARFQLRPGAVALLEIPVVVTVELEGTVWRRDGGTRRPAAGVRLELVDSKGQVAARAKSAADGFYLFDRLLPGAYLLRFDSEQVRRLGWAETPARELELDPEGEARRVVDIELDMRFGARAAQQGKERR